MIELTDTICEIKIVWLQEGSTDSTSNEEESDPSKVPNFCVLLHGALKVNTKQISSWNNTYF